MGKDHKNLLNNLQEIRRSAGFTQKELSESAEVSRKSINAIENGIYVPSTVLAIKIARTLNCSVEDLFQLPWYHWMVKGDLFCTLYLQFSSKFQLLNVLNGLAKEWFGLRTLFTIRANYIELLQNERFTLYLRLRWIWEIQDLTCVWCWNLPNFFWTHPKSESLSEGEGKDLINCVFFLLSFRSLYVSFRRSTDTLDAFKITCFIKG